MSSISTIRDDLMAAAESVGLAAYAQWPDTFVLPGVAVTYGQDPFIVRHTLPGNSWELAFELCICVTLAAGVAAAQQAIDPYLSPGETNSLIDALDATGVMSDADYAQVVNVTPPATMQIGSVEVLGCYVRVQVVT